MSADLDVVCPLYGPQYDGEHTSDYAGLITENPNLPAMFLLWVKTTPPAPCPTFGLCQFGPGQDSGGSSHLCRGRPRLWRRPARHYFHLLDSHADTFIDLVMGRGEAGVGEAAEIPRGLYQVQQYTFEGGFGKADVTCAVDDAKTKVYMTFVAFDQQQVMEGVLNDGIITVTYDQSGFMTNDAQAIYNAADQNNWQPVA